MRIVGFASLVACLVVVVGCATSGVQPTARGGSSESEAARNRARPYEEAAALLMQYENVPGCDGSAVEAKLQDLEADVARWNRVSTHFPHYAREARERHTALTFQYADAALHRRCLEAADRTCRRVFDFYVGALYSGIRDRARLGIDDVRAARSGG